MPAAIDFSRPGSDQVEVTVLGNGDGESLVIHIGNDRWVIVDSFWLDSSREVPAASWYLNELEVHPDDVVAIVTTHWDDDHLKGTAKLLTEYRLAKFHCSAALCSDEFLTLLGMRHPRRAAPPLKSKSRVREIAAVRHQLKHVENGMRGPRRVELGSDIVDLHGRRLPLRVVAPHDALVEAMVQQFADATQLEREDPVDSVVVKDRNLGSVVLWFAREGARALLAGDLVNNDRSGAFGWQPVLSALRDEAGAQVYKVAHHGSGKSQDERVWSELLEARPHAAVTAFTGQDNPLPQPAARRAIAGKTNLGLLAGQSDRQEMIFYRGQDKALAERASVNNSAPRAKAGKLGAIRLRRNATPDREWEAAVHGNVAEIRLA